MRALAFACLLLTSVLAGCGGGGGGGGAEPPGGGGSSDVFGVEYFPLASGDRRIYSVRTDGGPAAETRELIGASATVEGRSALELRDESGDLQYVSRTADGVFLIPGPAADALTRAFGPLEVLRFGLAAGRSVVTADRSVQVDLDSDGRNETVALRWEITFVGIESVSAAGTTYPAAARVRTLALATIRFTGGETAVTTTADEWYVAGIGRVRSVATGQATGGPSSTDIEELQTFKVGARRSETVAPTVEQAPTAGSYLGASPQIVLRFSEVVDPATVDQAAGVRLLDAAGATVPAQFTLAGDGRGVSLSFATPLVDGQYTLRLGSGIADWADNRLAARDIALIVDATAPAVVSSVPAAGATSAPLTGTLSFTFSEDLRDRGTAPLQIAVVTSVGTQTTLPATLSGRTLSATVVDPLLLNQDYTMTWLGDLVDAAGLAASRSTATTAFRTTPGPLEPSRILEAGLNSTSHVLGDINGDGLADLITVAEIVGRFETFAGVRLARAGGGFAPRQTLFTMAGGVDCTLRGPVIADFDGDGRNDIGGAQGCTTDRLSVFLQTSPGVFMREAIPGRLTIARHVALDLNGDGRAELMTADLDSNGLPLLRAMTRSPAGMWSEWLSIAMGGYAASDLQMADIDGDGQADLAWLRYVRGASPELAWAIRQGTGFGAVQSIPLGLPDGGTSLAMGDLSGDGRADAVVRVTPFASTLMLLRARPGGGWEEPRYRAVVAPIQGGNFALGDVDRDGRLDIIINHGPPSGLGVVLVSGDGEMVPERVFPIQSSWWTHDSLIVVDLDGDGLNDVLARDDWFRGHPWPAGVAWPQAAPAHRQGLRLPGWRR
jgi:methionine-rich copper-binding protein CopC